MAVEWENMGEKGGGARARTAAALAVFSPAGGPLPIRRRVEGA